MRRIPVSTTVFMAMLSVACSSNQPLETPPPMASAEVSAAVPAAAPMPRQAKTPLRVEPAEYPRIVELEGGTVTVHHPQIEEWQDFGTLTGWVAIEVREAEADEAWIGSVLLAAQTDVDFDERLVVLHDLEVRERKFPDGEPTDSMKALIEQAVSRSPRAVLLDVLLRALPEEFEIPDQHEQLPELNFDPPRILVSTEPLQLMLINGEPVAAPVEGADLEFLVNTNWDVFRDTLNDRWYVLNEGAWQVNNFLASGDWETTTRLPAGFGQLPLDDNWQAVHAAMPAVMPEEPPTPFVVSMEPTELILIEGEPDFEEIGDTGINLVRNTRSDLFELGGRFYYLAAGRWFMADQLDGDWAAVEGLPEAFASIPDDHEKGHVLVAVPGTANNRAARIEAVIPRQASISKDAGQGLEVTYAGDPQFVDISGTELGRAVNTPYQVISHNGYYYLCHNAVWYFAIKPEGPWSVATNIPEEIYRIPATDPSHNVTYVYVDADDDDDDYVNYSYTSGYTGTFSTSIAIVYGTGWYYDPWHYYYPWGYPAYWHYPATYGYGAWYNPATGRYGERVVGYGPYGGYASTAVYNPRTGGYARGDTVWDHDEMARSGYGYNPRTDTFAAGNMYYDFDDNEGWRESYVERGDRWVYGETRMDGDQRYTEYETSRGVEGTSTRQWDGDTMTGSGTIQGENRSAQTTSRIDEQGASIGFEGSEGGSLDVSKDRGEEGRDISGTTAGGKEFAGESRRTDSGAVNTRLESDTGGQAAIRRDEGNRSFAGESASGDLYAGRNGNVYKKTDDGWSQYGEGGWSTAQQLERQYSGSIDRGSLESRAGRYEGSQFDRGNLNRQYDARQSGQRNYSSFQDQRGSYQRGARSMPRGGARRRR